MIKLSKNIRTIAEDADELGSMIRAVRRNKGGEGVFCVLRSDATEGLMEIVPLSFAVSEAARRELCVFGLAKGKTHAMELVRILVDEMAQRGSYEVSEYL